MENESSNNMQTDDILSKTETKPMDIKEEMSMEDIDTLSLQENTPWDVENTAAAVDDAVNSTLNSITGGENLDVMENQEELKVKSESNDQPAEDLVDSSSKMDVVQNTTADGDDKIAAVAPESTNGNKEIAPTTGPVSDSLIWYDVGIFQGTSAVVKHYFSNPCVDDHCSLTSDNLPDYSECQKMELEPGTAYKFRIAAINGVGRGEWSDVSAFKTCLPGFPGAPSAIKISKSPEGAHLSWEPPPANSGKILEYSVCLAVKSAVAIAAHNGDTKMVSPSQLAFVRVYCGEQNAAVVSNATLTSAHVDVAAKPAIIFRIAAMNDKGYGPATQVRWLQDSAIGSARHAPPRRDRTAQ